MDSYEFTVQPNDSKSVVYRIIANKLGTDYWRARSLAGAPPFDGNDLDSLAGCRYLAIPIDVGC